MCAGRRRSPRQAHLHRWGPRRGSVQDRSLWRAARRLLIAVFNLDVRGPAVAAPGQPFTAGGLGAGPFAIRPACARRGPGVANWSHAGAHGSVGPPACAPGALSIARASSSHLLRPIRRPMHGGYGAVTRTRAAILGGLSAAGPETGLVGSPTRTQVSINQPTSPAGYWGKWRNRTSFG